MTTRFTALLAILCMTCGMSAAEPATYFDTRFGGTGGTLPAGWRDDSGWADVDIAYDNREEDGQRFLHAALTRLGSGFAQLAHPLPAAEGLRSYRFTALLRIAPGTAVRMGIRQKSAPWRMLAECTPDAVAGWQRIDRNLVLTRTAGEDVGFWIQLRSLGSLELAEAALHDSDAEAELGGHLQRIGGQDVPNLVRLSRFPLGLPSGWMLDRELCDAEVIRTDTGPVGPSGFPSLQIASSMPAQVVSAPFDCARPGIVHRLSLQVSGDWQGRLAVLEGGRVLAEMPVPPGDGWRQVGLAFTPSFIGDSHVHAMRLTGSGTLQIDAMQVAAGERQRPYATRLPAEVQLAMSGGDAAAGRCQFLDEPALVRWCATGAAAGRVLRITAIDQDGRAWAADPVTLGGAAMHSGTAELPIPPGRHAALRVVARIDDASLPDELVMLRIPRPVAWGRDAPGSPFGVHVLAVRRHLQMVKALGYNWVRLHDAGFEYTGWWWLERQDGAWTFRDDAIRRYRERHLSILGQLGTAPEWASHASLEGNQGAGPYFRRYFQPLSLQRFGDYVTAVTTRHRDDIRHWFVWNEPWIATRWATAHRTEAGSERYLSSAQPQQDYAALVIAAAGSAKAVDSGLAIIGVNSSSVARTHEGSRARCIGGSEWTDGVVAAGGLDPCDAMDFHCYAGGDPDSIVPAVAEGLRIAVASARHADGTPLRPVWLTEGAPALPAADVRNGGYMHVTLDRPAPSPTALARRLVLWELAALAAGCERSFLYSTHTVRGLHEWPHHAALVAGDGSPHPAAVAIAAFHRQVEGLAYDGAVQLAPGLTAHRFARAGRAAAVLVDRIDGTPPDLSGLPSGLRVCDIWGNPDPVLGDGTLLWVQGDPAR